MDRVLDIDVVALGAGEVAAYALWEEIGHHTAAMITNNKGKEKSHVPARRHPPLSLQTHPANSFLHSENSCKGFPGEIFLLTHMPFSPPLKAFAQPQQELHSPPSASPDQR